jgi:hypothetical protein
MANPGRIVAVQTLWTKTNHAGSVSGGHNPDLVAEPSPFTAAARYAGGELRVETGRPGRVWGVLDSQGHRSGGE